MGWQDSLAKHHPIPAFFAAVISNIITGNKTDDNEKHNGRNYDDESSSSDRDYTYGPSDVQPVQYYYPPTPNSSSSSRNKPRTNNDLTYNQGHQVDYYNDGLNNEQQLAKSKGFWKRKDKHVVEKIKGYEEKGTVMRSYVDWNGQEVVEERDFEFTANYELQMSPARQVQPRRNRGDYQGAGRTRYN